MADSKVLVEVLHGTSAFSGGCNCSGCGAAGSCGSEVDNEQITQELAQSLKTSFGDKVEVKYVNIDEVGMDDYPNLNQVLQMGYPYPITQINGEPRFAGGIMNTEIQSVIAEMLS